MMLRGVDLHEETSDGPATCVCTTVTSPHAVSRRGIPNVLSTQLPSLLSMCPSIILPEETFMSAQQPVLTLSQIVLLHHIYPALILTILPFHTITPLDSQT